MDLLNYRQLVQDPGEQATLETAIRSAIAATDADEGSILLLVDEDRQLEFTMCCTRAGINAGLIGQRVPVTQGLVGMAIQSGETQIGAPTYAGVAQAAQSDGAVLNPSSVLAAPLLHGERALGVMTLVSFNPRFRFTLAHAVHYEAVARLVALLLHKQAVIDELRRAPSAVQDGPDARLLRAVGALASGSPERVAAVTRVLEAIEGLN